MFTFFITLPSLMGALVTGGAGFIGSNLVDALIARGEEVVVLDDMSTGRRDNLDGALAAGAELVEGDIADADAIGALIERSAPERVFHLAAQIDVRRSVADPVFDLSINVAGTVNLLHAAANGSPARFVMASTGGAIYGEGEGRTLPLPENAETLPDAPYGQSKLAAEGYLSLWSRLYGLSGIALRLGNVYGPRQDPLGEAGVAAIFSGALLEGRRPRVFGTGEQTRDYVYVGDVVEALLAAAESDATGAVNIGTGVESSVLELGRRLAEACGTQFDPEMAPARPGEVQRISIDSTRAAELLGWRARVDLAEGLRRTVDSLR